MVKVMKHLFKFKKEGVTFLKKGSTIYVATKEQLGAEGGKSMV